MDCKPSRTPKICLTDKEPPFCSRSCTLSSCPLPITRAHPRLDHLSTSPPIRLEARMCFIDLSPKAMEHLKTGHSQRRSGKLVTRSSIAPVVCFLALDGSHSSKRPATSSTQTDQATGAASLSAYPNPVPAGSPDQELGKTTIT